MDEKNLNRKPLTDTAAVDETPAATQDSVWNDTIRFLRIANDPVTRRDLLVRLQELGLLSSFLEEETGTI